MPSSHKRPQEVLREQRKRAKIASASSVSEKLTSAGLTVAQVTAACADATVKAKLVEVGTGAASAAIAKTSKLPKGWLAAIKPALRTLEVPVKAFKRAALDEDMRAELYRRATAPPPSATADDSSSSSDSDSDSDSDSEGSSSSSESAGAAAAPKATIAAAAAASAPAKSKKRARVVIDPNAPPPSTDGLSPMTLSCRDCAQSFVWSVEGQALYRAKSWTNTPVTCDTCRERNKRARAKGKVCHAFLKGACVRGEECWFSHACVPVPGRSVKKASMRPAGVCFQFLRGKCARGDSCRFDHSQGKEGEGGASHYKEAQGPCFAFQKGQCTRGDSCMFSHTVATASSGYQKDRAAPAARGGGTCYAFQKGECDFGDSCRFQH